MNAPQTAASTAANPAEAFYSASPVAGAIGALLRAAQALAPALAVGLARRVFCTPLPPKWAARRVPVPAQWSVERWPFERATLTVYRSRQARIGSPLVLLAHGWGGHAMQWEPLARALLAAGFDPVLLDFPAHGRSGGHTSTLPQFTRAIEYAAARLGADDRADGATGHGANGGVHALVAHSLGANAAAQAVARGVRVRRLLLLAPVASPRGYTRLFARVFGLSETTRAAMQAALEAREAIVMPQFEPCQAGPRIQVPTLVLHDLGDQVNPHEDGAAFAQAVPGARLVSTQGLGHRKLLRDPGVAEEIRRFLA